jgi:hypothetical protein
MRLAGNPAVIKCQFASLHIYVGNEATGTVYELSSYTFANDF